MNHIIHRARKKHKLYMQPQKASNCQINTEQEQSYGHYNILLKNNVGPSMEA